VRGTGRTPASFAGLTARGEIDLAAGTLLRSVLADQVRDRLLERILDGSYPPDSRIVETSVAKELGTSQAPVREALRGLATLGVVEIIPFRGARVRQLQPEELLEAYVVRSAIETLAAKLAVPRMTDADIENLVALGDQMQEAAEAGDGRTVAEHDVSFHGRIVELSGNRTLLRVWRSLEPFSRTYLTLLMPGSDPQWSAGLHPPIVDSLRRRDISGVIRALEMHFTEISDVLASRLETTPPADGADPSAPDSRAQKSSAGDPRAGASRAGASSADGAGPRPRRSASGPRRNSRGSQ
jgi:DNA-binding GntR family transcriptional regulator